MQVVAQQVRRNSSRWLVNCAPSSIGFVKNSLRYHLHKLDGRVSWSERVKFPVRSRRNDQLHHRSSPVDTAHRQFNFYQPVRLIGGSHAVVVAGGTVGVVLTDEAYPAHPAAQRTRLVRLAMTLRMEKPTASNALGRRGLIDCHTADDAMGPTNVLSFAGPSFLTKHIVSHDDRIHNAARRRRPLGFEEAPRVRTRLHFAEVGWML